ncbi:MAG: hypothetical protein K6G50_06010 [bacterium]|nr:hypothetical protein [bacterium]
MSKAFLFERNSCLVDIEGREFKLEEFSAKQAQKFVDLINTQVSAVAKDFAGKKPDEIQDIAVNDPQKLDAVFNSVVEAEAEALRMVLAHPSDGGKVEEEWLADMPNSLRRKLLEKQIELNELERVLGNQTGLLTISMIGRLSQGLNGQKS